MAYRIEQLPNGLTRVFDCGSKLVGLYGADGRYHSGDLRAPTLAALLAALPRPAAAPHDDLRTAETPAPAPQSLDE